MTIDINELRQLTQAVSGWSNCNQAWLDQSEDVPAAVVGHIDEDGNTYPIATIDCDQYYAANQSLPLAKFYAAANPASVSELLDRLETAEKEIALKERVIDALGSELNAVANERDTLRAKIEQMERQEPVGTLHDDGCFVWRETAPHQSNYAGWKMVLYALPGAHPSYLPSDLAEAIIADMQAQYDSEMITENDSCEALIRLDGAIAAVEDNFAAATEAKP